VAPIDSYGAPAGIPDAFRATYNLQALADAASGADADETAAVDPEWLARVGRCRLTLSNPG